MGAVQGLSLGALQRAVLPAAPAAGRESRLRATDPLIPDARKPDSARPSAATRELGPISVVVCNYDGEQHLPPCLDAIAALEGEIDEVIVVDNASTDTSVAIVEQYFERWRAEGRRWDLSVVAMGENRGPCPARNRGMRAAKNRWVLALDNDAVCRPDVLAKLVAAAEADSQAVLVQPRSVFADDPARVHYDGGNFHYVGLIALRNFYVPLVEARGEGVARVDCAVSVALLVDRETVIVAGGYDESFFILFEDLDLSYRLRTQGHAIVSVPDAIVEHRGGTAGISFREGPRYPTSRVRLHSRNRWIFILKNYRLRTLVVAAPGLLVYELAGLGFAVLSGGFGAWCAGKRDLLALRARLMEERRRAQRARRASDRSLLRGGPLTPTPDVLRSPVRRAAHAVLDLALRGWWGLARVVGG